LSSAQIQALIPTDVPTAFVQFTLAQDTGLALVLTREGIDCVKLPALAEQAAGKAGIAWLTAYYRRAGDPHAWERGMDALLSPIGTALLPLWEMLRGKNVERAVLAPNRWLHIFPLQACLLADGKRRVADAFEV